MPRALFIARVFPPQAGGGALRATKLAKYLPGLGWDLDVIAGPVQGAQDDDLAGEVDSSVRVHRLGISVAARGAGAAQALRLGRIYRLIRAAVLIGDDGFADLAETVALGVARGRGADVVLATSLPFSSAVAGALVAAQLDLPLVVDLRDPWAYAPRAQGVSASHLSAMRAIERWTLARASAVVTMTDRTRMYLPPGVAPRVIPNGFDPADFAVTAAPRTSERRRLVYTGSLYGRRRPEPLLDAIRAYAEPERVELVIAGSAFEHEATLRQSGLHVDLLGYVPHRDAAALMLSADAILVLVGDEVADEQPVPGKLYEAVAAGPPVICWARANSEAAKVMAEVSAGVVVEDAAGLARAVAAAADGSLDASSLDARAAALEKYDRRAIAREMAALLRAQLR